MIVGLGLDVCEIARARRLVDRHGARFLRKVLTAAETSWCLGRPDVALAFAGRFAAKEAAVKALGSPPGLRWQDMEVLPADGAPPALRLYGIGAEAAAARGVARILLSITHDGGVAAAVVLLEA